MNRLRKIISVIAVSAALLISGCAVRQPETGSQITSDDQQVTEGTARQTTGKQTTESQSEPAEPDHSEEPQIITITPSIDVNGNASSVANAVYCVTDDVSMIVASGERNGVYVLLLLASTTGFEANTSFSQDDFGNVMELAAALVDPSIGVVSGISQVNLSEASFSITDISDDSMNVSMSAELISSDVVFEFNMSGTVTLTDWDSCTQIISEINDLAAGSQSGSSGSNTSFRCTSCYGDGKCRYCKGDGSCHDCFGLVDHCISCGGSNVCQYCLGNGVCKYCGGEGVMY